MIIYGIYDEKFGLLRCAPNTNPNTNPISIDGCQIDSNSLLKIIRFKNPVWGLSTDITGFACDLYNRE